MSQLNFNDIAIRDRQIAGNININATIIKEEVPEPQIPDLSETQILENQMKTDMEKYQKKVQSKKDAYQKKQEVNKKKIEELEHNVNLSKSNIALQKENIAKLQLEVELLIKEIQQGEQEIKNHQNQNKKDEEKNSTDDADNRNNQAINDDQRTRCQLIEQICIVEKRLSDQPRHSYFNNIRNSCMN